MDKPQAHRFPYKWTLADAIFTKDKGKVFSCFACGGGSSFGYKLAGFDVVGCNEIDPKMIAAYVTNHDPKYAFCEPIQTFKLRDDLPAELYELDILDGSPPCSSFSMAGNREKDWGSEKKFREGQAKQVLDTLFFDFIDLGERLQPKVIIAENVKGLLLGNAKKYVRRIYEAFDKAGYVVQHFLLDASKMGVPQRRERVFFIAMRKDLAEPFMHSPDLFKRVPKLVLEFNEPEITFGEVMENCEDDSRIITHAVYYDLWFKLEKGAAMDTVNNGNGFNNIKLDDKKIVPTLSSSAPMYMPNNPHYLGDNHYSLCGTFPTDYIHSRKNKYLIGMSVPPVMTAQIATEVYEQWLRFL